MNEISQLDVLDVLDLLSANQTLLERLEAKNARLRDSVAELMLEIQALREALGYERSENRPPIGATRPSVTDGQGCTTRPPAEHGQVHHRNATKNERSTGSARERHGLFRYGAFGAARIRRPSIQYSGVVLAPRPE